MSSYAGADRAGFQGLGQDNGNNDKQNEFKQKLERIKMMQKMKAEEKKDVAMGSCTPDNESDSDNERNMDI